MSRRNRRAAKRQDANSAFGDKIGAAAGSLSALYLLPTVAQAAIVHNPGPGPSLDLNAFFSTSVTWKVDGANPAFALKRSATSFTQPVGGGGCPTTTTCVAVANTIRTGTLFFSNALNGRGFVTSGGRLAALNTGLLIGSALAAPYAFGGPVATLARRSQSLYYGEDNPVAYFPDGTNLIGFRFLNPSDSNTVDFGWAHLSFD